MYRIELEELKKEIYKKLHELRSRDLKIEIKSDKSPVTEFDIFVSEKTQEIFSKRHGYLNFYSEENPEEFKFPVIVLDPIDGTREFVKGYGECAVSLAILNSADINDPKNYGWIYNPFTGFEISSDLHISIEPRTVVPPTIHVMVSRSEWEKNLVDHERNEQISLTPMGSIAYKLGLLAGGACDVVISKRNKNIWDIAAGIVICHSRGIKTMSEGGEVTLLNQIKYKAPFIWGKEREIEIASYLLD
ncbi:inositol monophosphatase family protein [Bacteriovorax sp. Seq25_V]|uniref:inositol monophosphatase family protein n=1 Tax=Bacteriovorax sp. Seq25_V TaxID=1201288 RepID=UPI00038A2045|nr:inositol monophosphatase family protein [Bacteriovorax sp. Seq25_V]EQC44726.1 inositol monophosphatase family protein [Bacteriovorax sp. Seq25_V]